MNERISINYSDHDDDTRDRARWRVDLATNTATHDTGLVMQFQRDPATPGAWDGKPTNFEEWLQRQSLPLEDIARSVPRLIRLAGDAFQLARKSQKP